MGVLQTNGHGRTLDRLPQDSLDRWMQSSAVTASLSVGMLIVIVAMGGLLSRGSLSQAKKKATVGATELSSSSKPNARAVK
jgi:hypothetical protein